MSDYLVDEFVNVQPGQPIRLFRFGQFFKNGKMRDITRELASKFKLPKFKPAIKLGSHKEEAIAGGHITSLEVGEDGIYANVELNEKGAEAIENGSYRYQSPEIVWEGAGIEDAESGELIEGPLIVGLALTHMPHFGEAAALYNANILDKENKIMTENVTVPAKLWDKFMAWFDTNSTPEPKPEPKPDPAPVIDVDKFEALTAENKELKEKFEAQRLEAELSGRVEKYAAQIAETKATTDGAGEMLASMNDDQAVWVLTQFKALSEQIDESALTGEVGSIGDAPPDNPKDKLDAAITAKMEEAKVDYNEAYRLVYAEQADLVKEIK